MRHEIVHGYFSIDLELVWNVAKYEMPRIINNMPQLMRMTEEYDREK